MNMICRCSVDVCGCAAEGPHAALSATNSTDHVDVPDVCVGKYRYSLLHRPSVIRHVQFTIALLRLLVIVWVPRTGNFSFLPESPQSASCNAGSTRPHFRYRLLRRQQSAHAFAFKPIKQLTRCLACKLFFYNVHLRH